MLYNKISLINSLYYNNLGLSIHLTENIQHIIIKNFVYSLRFVLHKQFQIKKDS
jgi:hypothetical protein